MIIFDKDDDNDNVKDDDDNDVKDNNNFNDILII